MWENSKKIQIQQAQAFTNGLLNIVVHDNAHRLVDASHEGGDVPTVELVGPHDPAGVALAPVDVVLKHCHTMWMLEGLWSRTREREKGEKERKDGRESRARSEDGQKQGEKEKKCGWEWNWVNIEGNFTFVTTSSWELLVVVLVTLVTLTSYYSKSPFSNTMRLQRPQFHVDTVLLLLLVWRNRNCKYSTQTSHRCAELTMSLANTWWRLLPS